MSVLTRIKNNQITDSTILANTKIVAGSIVGSLFNANLTMTSDVTITGNLTVQGSSTYLTVASTNTYVNDPLIVLNNAFAGTNTYDIGLIINRGSLTDVAWIWNESNDRFEATFTSESGTTYGTINNSGYASVKVGNIAVNTLTDTRVTFVDSNSNIVDSSAFTYTANVLTVNNFEFNDANNTITLSASGAGGNIKIASPGGLVDFNDNILGNIADPVNNGDAVSLSYLNSQISSGVTNLQLDDTDITITDDGIATGLITANIDGTQILSATANSTAFYGNSSSAKLYVDRLNSNVGVNSTLYVGDDITVAAGAVAYFLDTTDSTGVASGAVQITGGLSVGANVHIGKDLHVLGNLIIEGNTTVVETNNVSFTDSIIELHTLPGGGNLTVDDGRDVGVRFHYYKASNDNAFLGWDNTTGYLEWYASGVSETANVTITGEYGTFKTGNITLVSTTQSGNVNSGALQVDGGAGINGNLYVGGNVRFTSTQPTTSYNTGALVVSGGVGIDGNVFTKSGHQFVIGEELIASTIRGNLVTYSPAHFLVDHNANSRIVVQNINSGANASIGVAFVADNGSEDDHFLDIGINGSTRNDDMLAPNDAFIHVAGGNLMLGSLSPEQYIHFHIGSMANASSMVQELTPNGVMIMKDTISTDHHTGALVVEGGVGIVANLNIGDGAVINDHQSRQPFRVYGNIATSLIYADSIYDHVVIGGSNVTIQPGATLKVNSTSSMMVPVGGTSDRPSNTGNVDVAGMLRYNTSTTNLEYYTGAEWKIASNDTNFTIITSEQFNGNDSNVSFTLGNATTTNGCVVSINGILQIPSTAYSIAGNLLTFTEAPATGDVVDVRVLTVTSAVGELQSPNGYNTVSPNNTDGVRFFSGTTSGNKTLRATYGPAGMFNLLNGTKTSYDQTATNIASSAAAVIIDEFSTSSYSTAKYIIQTKNGANKLESMEALVVAEDGNASVVTYGIVNSHGAAMGTLSANVVSGNCRLYYTSTSLSNSNVKVMTTYIV